MHSLNSDGPIKALEFIIKSNDQELDFNLPSFVEVVSNKVNDHHHIVVYSLDGYVIEDGLLFNTENGYEIIEFKAANSNHKFVNIVFQESLQPETFVLKQNYPNPFNPTTTIDIEMGMADNIILSIYDINGRKITTLANGYFTSGNYSFEWNGNDNLGTRVAAGIYIYTLMNSTEIITNKMVMLK